MINLIFIWLKLLPNAYKIWLFSACILMLISGVLESLTLVSLYPLISLFLFQKTGDEGIPTAPSIFYSLNTFLGVNHTLLPWIFAAIYTSSILIRLFNIWINSRFSAKIGNYMNTKIFSSAINMDYVDFKRSSSSSIISASSLQITETVQFINFILQLISSVFISIGILTSLFLLNPTVSISLFLIVFILYFCIGFTSKKRLTLNSSKIVQTSKDQIKFLQQSLRNIKEIYLSNNQYLLEKSFSKIDKKLRYAEAENLLLGSVPRYVIEYVLIMTLLISSLFIFNDSFNPSFIPLITAFFFGIQKLLPRFNKYIDLGAE